MMTGDRAKTSNFTIDYWWESENPNRDMQLGKPVATWVGQNAKVLDKKHSCEVLKLLIEQFPYLMEIDVRHVQLQHARYRR